jgi:hypothetical protein
MTLSVESIQDILIRKPLELLEEDREISYMLGDNGIRECACSCEMGRTRPECDDRKRYESLFLSAVRQFIPEKNPIRICAIGAGGCFNELVLHALLTKMEKTVQWVMVDPRGVPPAFKDLVQEMSPDSTLGDDCMGFETMMQLMPPPEIDIFASLDAVEWKKVRGYIEPYMEKSSKPTLAICDQYVDKCVYCPGNNSPCIDLSYELTSNVDLRPSFIFKPII